MFDILFNSKRAERHPLEILLVAFFYSSFSIFFGYWLFPDHASIVSVFLIVISCLYVTQNAIKIESVHEEYMEGGKLFKAHWRCLKLLLFLFFGISIAFILWSFILPLQSSENYFSLQIQVFEGINTANAEDLTAKVISPGDSLLIILENNLKVLFMSLAVSLIYGAGAILVLTWNASVIGFVIGSAVKKYGILNAPAIFTKYFLHGLPEMFSYFIAILVGGIIYSLFVSGEFRRNISFNRVFKHLFILVASAVVILLFAGLIEVYLSPLI